VTVTAAHDGWERVTFGDALNMATGIGENWPQRAPNHPFADSDRSPKFFRWRNAKTAQEKLDLGFSFGKYPWGPGEVVRFNDLNTFVLRRRPPARPGDLGPAMRASQSHNGAEIGV
jgi:hypothetical protein